METVFITDGLNYTTNEVTNLHVLAKDIRYHNKVVASRSLLKMWKLFSLMVDLIIQPIKCNLVHYFISETSCTGYLR